MKIIATSNFDEETFEQTYVAENINNDEFASTMCLALNVKFSGDTAPVYYRVVADDYKLWRGMKELV